MAHDPRRLYEGCYRRLVAQAYALVGNVGRAEEAVQAAFVRAILARMRFGRADEPESWLRSATLAGVYRGRRRDRVRRLLRRPVPPTVPDGPDLPVLAALRALPPRDRDAVALHGVAGLPVPEIAAVSGTSSGRAAQRLARGRAELERTADLGGQPPLAALAVVRDAVEDEVHRPPYDLLAARARATRGRRRIGAAVTVAVLVGGGIAVREATRPTILPVGRAASQVIFTDRNTGYALIKPCRSDCRLQVARTHDGGKTWAARTVPHGDAHTASAFLTVCCGGKLSVDLTGPNGHGGLRLTYATSLDGGRSWRLATRASRFGGRPSPIGTAPAGWPVVSAFDPAGSIIVAEDPVDGVTRRLAHQPALSGIDVSPAYARGGRIWATGDDPHHQYRQQLAQSEDDGATWQTVDPPPLRHNEEVAVVYPAPHGGLYVQTKRPGDGTLRRTWRRDDGVWVLLPEFRVGVDAAITSVLPNGELWLSDRRGRVWVTHDGGLRPTPVHRPTVNGRPMTPVFAGHTSDGLIYATAPAHGRDDVVFTSTDSGEHWSARVVAARKSHVE